MPLIDALVSCPVHDSFRVRQVAGLFDLPPARHAHERFSVEVPTPAEPWQIGLIVGPSGTGKSTVARAAFPGCVYGDPATDRENPWPPGRAVIDAFGDLPVKQITHALTAVGFSSPPAWVKPYAVLSNGEKFRCDLARALLADAPLVVFDEFTSVVDRTVARVGSAAVAKAIRSGKIPRRFVAVSCHYDIAPWLEPDWLLDMASRTLDRDLLARGRLRRPPIRLQVVRCRASAWRLFEKHHYLSRTLNPAAVCYLALWEDQPVAFCGVLAVIGKKGHDRVSRLVVLPDYQGIGVGRRLLNAVAELHARANRAMHITTSHPAFVHALAADPDWRCTALKRTGSPAHAGLGHNPAVSKGRAVASFKFRGNKADEPPRPQDARRPSNG